MREIPENFCHKDRETTEQAMFYCLVCNCDLKSLKPLRDHVTGSKHIRKACDSKRRVMGMPPEPQNAPKVKKLKRDRPLVDIGQSLESKLSKCGEPAIGLEYITEFRNPRERKAHPMYTCKLEGCKSAWGTSDDIYNHVIRPKHHKNFFRKLNPDDARVAGMTGADILTKAAEFEQEQYPDGERDYNVIVKVEDYAPYRELRDRPDDWSEKKASLGLVGAACNSNMEPLGRRGGEREPSPMFDTAAWAGWRPTSREQAIQEFKRAVGSGLTDVKDKVENFNGKKGDEEHQEIEHYSKVYRELVAIMAPDLENGETDGLLCELKGGMDMLEEKLEGEDRAMKEVSKMMAELEEEIARYNSERTTRKYKNVQERLTEITKKLAVFRPAVAENVAVKAKHNKRLGSLWKEFESRSDSLVETLEQQMGEAAGGATSRKGETAAVAGGASDRKGEERKAAVETYRQALTKYVQELLEREHKGCFPEPDGAARFADKQVRDKYLSPEVNTYTKKGAPWNMFQVTERTKEAVKKHIKSKMERK
jgi:hypothetical protein